MKTLAPDLVDKMERRARRAFAIFDKGRKDHISRIGDLTATSCTYRLPHKVGKAAYSGPKVSITRTADGSIVVPKAYGLAVLDLLTKEDLKELKEHEGLVRAYKYTDAKGESPIQTRNKIKYEVGKSYEETDADTSSTDCAKGINLSSLDWCEKSVGSGKIFAFELEAPKDVASVPPQGDKFRAFRCKVVEELEIVGGKAKPRSKAPTAPPKDEPPPAKPADPPVASKPLPLPIAQKPEPPKESLSEKIRRILGRKKK